MAPRPIGDGPVAVAGHVLVEVALRDHQVFGTVLSLDRQAREVGVVIG
ncbi:hypothetical protein ABZT03_18120 [Streptomyces sp. NPDC005574]